MLGALFEGHSEIWNAAILFEQVSKSFVRKFLESRAAVPRQQVYRRPILIIELHTLAGHVYTTG
jgi:hypothetical protein